MIKPVQLFHGDKDPITDFSKVPVVDVFNEAIVPTANRLVQQAQEQFAQLDEISQYDESLMEQRNEEARRSQQLDVELLDSVRKSREQSLMSDDYESSMNPPDLPGPSSSPLHRSPPVSSGYTKNASRDAARIVFENEVHRDSSGRPTVYKPPSGDGGGRFEFAGITAKYQPKEAAHLADLVRQGKHREAEEFAMDFYRKRAAPFVQHSRDPGIRLQLTDTVHHRGEGGLRQILQRATGSKNSSYSELISMLEKMPNAHDRFNQARRSYELEVVDRGRESRAKFRPGLMNRFDKVHREALNISRSNGD